MKRTFLILTLLLTTIMMSAATKVKVTRIDPTDWFVGLKDASLQLMVYGPGIREAKVTTDYPGVRIDSLVQLDSPNYLLVYLHLNGAKAGQMMLNFEVGKKTVKYPHVEGTAEGGQRPLRFLQCRRALYAHARPFRKG